MSLNLSSDLLLDVANAANPASARAAAQRLAAFSPKYNAPQTASAAHLSFPELVMPMRAPAKAHTPADAPQLAATRKLGDPMANAMAQFERVVTQSFVEAMFPKNANALFGQGYAGQVWKSFMAEAIAGETAQAGGLGLARSLIPDASAKATVDG